MEKIFNIPIVGVVMCRQLSNIDGNNPEALRIQQVQEKYLRAVVTAGGLPIALPHQLASYAFQEELLPHLDGIMLPGSYSNLQPHLYGEVAEEPKNDPGRDALSLPLIHQALNQHIPLLGICRGMQEIVVATEGTLRRNLHEFPELLEHREDNKLPLAQQYGLSHEVIVQAGGVLSTLIPDYNKFEVNSLHDQGVKTLGPRIRIEALAADGLIEAISVRDQPFALGVQWHPEWDPNQHVLSATLSQQLFAGFISACRCYKTDKTHQ